MAPKRASTANASAPVRLSTGNTSSGSAPAAPAPAPAARRQTATQTAAPVVGTRQTRLVQGGQVYVLLQEYDDGRIRVAPITNERRRSEYAERNAEEGEEEVEAEADADAEAEEQSEGGSGEDRVRRGSTSVTGNPAGLLRLKKVVKSTVKWTAEMDRILLIRGLGRVMSGKEMKAIAGKIAGATPRAVENRFTKLRNERDRLLVDEGIATAEELAVTPAPAKKKRGRKSAASVAPVNVPGAGDGEAEQPPAKKTRLEGATTIDRPFSAVNTGGLSLLGSPQPPQGLPAAGPMRGHLPARPPMAPPRQPASNGYPAPPNLPSGPARPLTQAEIDALARAKGAGSEEDAEGSDEC